MTPKTTYESDTELARKAELKRKFREDGEVFDENFGYQRYCITNGNKEPRRGWIFNMLATVSEGLFASSVSSFHLT